MKRKPREEDRTLEVLDYLQQDIPKAPGEDEDVEDDGEEEDGIPKQRKRRPKYL